MTDPERTPQELEHLDQIRTLAADLVTIGNRAIEEADTGPVSVAEESLIQIFDLFTAARAAGILP